MRELELKLAVDEPFVTPHLPPAETKVGGMEELPALDLRATYYDTSDLRLARSGITLRYRTGESGQSPWSLKLPSGGDDANREELAFGGADRRVPDGALDLVTAFTRGAPLKPVARLRTQRRHWSLRDPEGAELAELVDDRVSVLRRGRVVSRFRELEIESRTLDRSRLELIADALQSAGASAPEQIPKAVRALGPRALEPPDFVIPDKLGPRKPAAYAIQAALGHGLRRIVLNDPGARLGDAEAVHQMRVGARRLRSDLRTFSSLLHRDRVDELRGELRWLAGVLGEVRDLDVMRSKLRADATGLSEEELRPLFSLIEDRQASARKKLNEALRSDRYVNLIESLVGVNRSPPVVAGAWRPAREVLPKLVRPQWRKLARTEASLGEDDSDEQFHRIRIRAKRLRYAAEAVAPALGRRRGKPAKRLARRAAAVQDLLGALQDAVVSDQLLRETAGMHPDNGPFNFASGRLLERQETARRDARASFPEAWGKTDRRKLRRWMIT
jgi:CHAD domain-containing protein